MAWDTSSYKPSTVGTYTLPGTIALTNNIVNPKNVKVQIKVKVIPQKITKVTNPTNITVEYGTPAKDLKLPGTVEVTYDTGKKDTVNVTWDTSSYNANLPGIYTLPGTLTLADDVENPNNLNAQIKVTVHKRRVTGVTNPEDKTVGHGTSVSELELPETIEITYNTNEKDTVHVTWDTSTYNSTEPGDYILTGTLTLPEDAENPDNILAETTVTVNEIVYRINSIQPILDIKAAYNTFQSELELPETVTVNLSDNGGQRDLPVTWTPENGYNPTLTEQPQVFIGTFSVLPDDVENRDGKTASVNVIVKKPEGGNIVSFLTEYITSYQSIPLSQIKDVPTTVTAYLDNGETAELPVDWDDTLKPEQIGVQSILGKVTLTEGITNTNGNMPTLIVNIQAASYTATKITPDSASASIGTSEYSKEELISKYAPETVEVTIENNETKELFVLNKKLNFSNADNQDFNTDTPGTQTLIGRPEVTSNITVPEKIIFTLQVNINAPSTIIGVLTAMVNSYQEVPFEQIPNVPDKVTVILDNGQQREVEVQWKPDLFDDHVIGSQTILGDLINLPKNIINPSDYQANLQIHVQPASYEIVSLENDGSILVEDIPAGFSLAEVYEKLKPNTIKAELLRTSPNDGVTVTNEISFTIPEGINTDYDPEQATLHILNTELELTDNISNPGDLSLNVYLTTQPVTIVGEIEYIEMTTEEGTLYKDLDLPETISVNLSNGKTVCVPVVWGSEDEYIPFNGFNIIEGTLVLPDYIDEYTEPVYVFVTEIPAEKLTLTAITPGRIPETGTISVNLGASIEKIYNALETHTVEITLEDSDGNSNTQNITFTLTEEDNPDYDPAQQGEQLLTASLNLPENVENPDALTLQIAVDLKVYIIKSAKTLLIKGVTAGTPFEEIGLPEKTGVNYTDGSSGELPVTWTESDYQPNKIGAQKINGIFTEPLPLYAQNPNNRKPYAAITVVNPKVRIINAVQLPSTAPLSTEDETQAIPGYEEYLFSVELEH